MDEQQSPELSYREVPPGQPLRLDRSRSPPREIAQALRNASSPEIQIVDTPESPEITVNAGLTGGRQQIDRTLVVSYQELSEV
jgi:hypothetical protein